MPTGQRKKKAEPAVAEPAVAEPVAEQPVVPESPAPKKKTKKPIKVVAVVTPNGIEGSFVQEPRRPLIAHIPIRTTDAMFSKDNTSADPEPYNPASMDMFAGDQEVISTPAVNVATVETPTIYQADENRPMQCFAKVQLMVTFANDSKAMKLPESTEIACFWCSHSFQGIPCIIPEREVHGVYNVYGNFCCPECALAYVLGETIDPHVRWERIALLHRIYDRSGNGRMFPAPGREVLKHFGGPLSIESYRATISQGKVRVDTHMPPMVSILGSIDTKPIDFFDSSMKNTVTGNTQQDKTTKAEEGLRLRRTRPLKDRESTLDSVMNIQIKRGINGGKA
uniref:MYM-type domain-containing protein n=1 Tax=viral metagenome TaxID=1070528 RepID=A0A6C0JY12_9ZZZZ